MAPRWPAFVAAPLAVAVPAAHATTYLTVVQAQQALFPGASFAALAGRNHVWRVSSGGWFILDEVLGKHELITYAVGMDAEGRIAGIEILEYRESHGGEVRDPRWRAQFAGKTARDPLALDRDIRNISGATLSCRHLADGVKRILALYATELRQR